MSWLWWVHRSNYIWLINRIILYLSCYGSYGNISWGEKLLNRSTRFYNFLKKWKPKRNENSIYGWDKGKGALDQNIFDKIHQFMKFSSCFHLQRLTLKFELSVKSPGFKFGSKNMLTKSGGGCSRVKWLSWAHLGRSCSMLKGWHRSGLPCWNTADGRNASLLEGVGSGRTNRGETLDLDLWPLPSNKSRSRCWRRSRLTDSNPEVSSSTMAVTSRLRIATSRV